jgi:eukaryotic-like serine/threonine-protein kinase
MPAPSTTIDLLELVRKSGLIAPERLDDFLDQAGEDAASPKKLTNLLVGAGMITQFQAEQFLLGKWRGFTIGKYKVLERLGFGGTGTVYLCEHLMVRRKVAIKVLPATKADNPAALGRFYREARAAGVLDHPNLVKCHDIDQDGSLHFLVMDYVDGASLQTIITKFGPMTVDFAAHSIKQAARGMQHAHEAGLVHRDIKPANILLDRKGTIRVLDLGLARFFNDDEDLLTLKYDEKNVLGTADYVSPEQALNSHEVDIRADIYSLGGTFYFLLTGQPPFPEGKAAQKLIWHQVKEPTPVHELRPDVPKELSDVVTKMMCKKPAGRFATPAHVMAALEPWTAGETPPPPDEWMPRLCPAARSSSCEMDFDPTTPQNMSRPAGLRPGSNPNQRPLPTSEAPTDRLLDAQPNIDTNRSLRRARPAGLKEAANEVAVTSAPPVPPSDKLAVKAKSKPKTPVVKPPAKRKVTLPRLLAVLAASAVIGMTLRYIFRPVADKPAATVEAKTLLVTRAGQKGSFTSIRDALRHAKAGDRIVVLEETWEEALDLRAEEGKGVSIESNPEAKKPVVWRTPRTLADNQPLLRIDGVAGLRLKGFILEGLERVPCLIVIAGNCPGTTLEELHCQGFQQCAVSFERASGTSDEPVSLKNSRIAPGKTTPSALRFEEAYHVRIADNRLEGPYQSAIVLNGPATNLDFTRNRFYNAIDGILYRKATPPHPLSLTLASNTFCEIEKVALRFETPPPLDGSRVTLTSNLFARTGTLAAIDGFSAEPRNTPAQWIWFDEQRPVGEMVPEQRYFRKKFTVEGALASHAVLNVTGDAAFTVWLNGERIGHDEFLPHTKRVHSYDVAKYLRPGENVLAIQGTNKMGLAGVLAQLNWISAGSAPGAVVSDKSWKTAQFAPAGWIKVNFDDANWTAPRIVAAYGKGGTAWQNLVWDAVVQDQFQGRASQLFPDPSGNVRDWTSQESYPPFKAVPLHFELPVDRNEDARFLRYSRTSMLMGVGAPGVPPAEKK